MGSVALDDVETPSGKAERILGGAATFGCVAASRFVKPEMVGIVGDDFPEQHIRLFEECGVGTTALEKKTGKTFHWEGRYHENMIHRDTLLTELGVFEDWLPQIPESLRSMPYLFLGNIHPELQLHVLKQMSNVKLVGCDTMNLWINIARDELAEVISKVDVLIINDEEARMLTEKVSLSLAAKEILEMGPSVVIVKRGEHGATVHSRDRLFFCPALPIDHVADPTGAGDTFAGAMMGFLAKTGNTEFSDICRGVVMGTVLASFCVEDFSLNRLIHVDDRQMEDRRKMLEDMVKA